MQAAGTLRLTRPADSDALRGDPFFRLLRLYLEAYLPRPATAEASLTRPGTRPVSLPAPFV